ncbi:MAG: phosphopantothenoylcysteine decarboxylase [Deltaproteobacteria bacterium]
MSLKNRRILITAGPTWVAIDSVRVISNTASGETGTLLAQALAKEGAQVTLLMGPCGTRKENKKVRIIDFRFFEELERLLEKELSGGRYDAVVHSAAVSDFRPVRGFKGKIDSGKSLTLKLTRTPKLIELIRKKTPGALLVGFKFEPESSPKTLIEEARKLGKQSKCNLVVANTVHKGSYRALIVAPEGMIPEAGTKEELVDLLVMYLDAYFSRKPHSATCSCCKGR